MGLRNTYTTLQEEDIAVTLQYHLVQYILKRRSLLTTTGGDQGFFGGLEFANLKTCVYTSLFSRKQVTMVAFGNALLESLRPGWEEAYLDYEGLKELIGSTDTSAFDRRLRQEIEKVSLFALYQQGEIARAIGSLRLSSNKNQAAPLFASSSTMTTATSTALSNSTMFALSSTADAYTACAVELLHWQRYVCINAMGFRKIIKKFRKQKLVEKGTAVGSNDAKAQNDADILHLQQLANAAAIAAMHASLQQACQALDPGQMPSTSSPTELTAKRTADPTSDISYQHENVNNDVLTQRQRERYAWIRLHCTVSLIQAVRQYAQSMNESFTDFLSNKSMILTSSGGSKKDSPAAMRVFLHLDPDSILAMEPTHLRTVWEDEDYPFLEGTIGTQLGTSADRTWGGVDSVSLWLNLMSTLLYTVSCQKMSVKHTLLVFSLTEK